MPKPPPQHRNPRFHSLSFSSPFTRTQRPDQRQSPGLDCRGDDGDTYLLAANPSGRSMEAAPSGGQSVPLAEADWPPELRLPAPPAPRMDDSQFLGSIVGPAEPETALVLPKKRGRPPKTRDGPALLLPKKRDDAAPAKRKEDEGEVVCFICFDGGDLVMCDRRCCRVLRISLVRAPSDADFLSLSVGGAPRSTIRRASSATSPSSMRGPSGTVVSSSNAPLILCPAVTRGNRQPTTYL
jgi:hypothetical protein